MTLSISIVLLVIVFLLLALYLEWFRPAVSFFIAITIFCVFGILSPKDALSGLGNDQIAVIVLLLIVSDILSKSNVVDMLFSRILKSDASKTGFLARILFYVAPISAFINNTPLVAISMPYVMNWAKKNKISSSKFLIPLSFATIIGGTATLIGTSTNLIVNGMYVDSGYESLGIFDFFSVGFPMIIIGSAYLLLVSFRILPNNKDSVEEFKESSREYFLEAIVPAGSPHIGKTVNSAGLRNMQELFMVEIIRSGKIIAPVGPDEILEQNDRLIFTGATPSVSGLAKPISGLSLPKECEMPNIANADILEVVIAYNSSLIGKTVKESDFRGKYDGAIIAIHRNGEKLSGKIGQIELKSGDVLLVLAGTDFYKRTSGNQAFYLISKEKQGVLVEDKKAWVVVVGLVASVILSSLGLVSFFTALLLLVGISLLIKAIPLNEIRKGMDFNLIALMAMGLAMGKAMTNSGAADFIAEHVFKSINVSFGAPGLLAAIFIVTNLLSAFITNKAAMSIVFPISLSLALANGYELKPFVLIIAISAAASFITPIGYQTNLMVYGPGGYNFKDFIKIGLPLTIMYLVVSVLVLSYQYRLF